MKQEHNTMETKGFTGQKYELMGQVVLGTKHNRKHHVKLEFQINIEQYMEYLGHTYTKRLLIADLKFHVTLIWNSNSPGHSLCYLSILPIREPKY